MVAAKDMSDARTKAANLLQQFEECVKSRAKAEFEECVESRAKAEMVAARGMSDARTKGQLARVQARLLQAPGDTRKVAEIKEENTILKCAGDTRKVAEIQKENTILKRAVQIQASKLQESAHKAEEVVQLRKLLAEHEEKMRALEMHNYSLTLHLARATDGSHFRSNHGPDVC
eukprot:gene7230-338_t